MKIQRILFMSSITYYVIDVNLPPPPPKKKKMTIAHIWVMYLSNQNFYRINKTTKHGQSTFQFAASKIWVSVPSDLKSPPYITSNNRTQLLSTKNLDFGKCGKILIESDKLSPFSADRAVA